MLFINHSMEDLTFLVRTRPPVCARALLVFLLACPCSVFLNAGRSFENVSQRVLIVLVLHCYGNGYLFLVLSFVCFACVMTPRSPMESKRVNLW